MTQRDRRHRHRYRRRQDRVRRWRSSALLDGLYWKPVQAGLDGETRRRHRAAAVRLAGRAHSARGLPPDDARLAAPCGRARRRRDRHRRPRQRARRRPEPSGRHRRRRRPAGAADARSTLQIDLFARWGAPVVLVRARRALGTINHSLLSIEALRGAQIPLLGVAFVGDENADSERTIAEMGGVRRLGRLPILDPLNAETLARRLCRQLPRRGLPRRSRHERARRQPDLASVHAARAAAGRCRGRRARRAPGSRRRTAAASSTRISSWWVITHGHCHPAHRRRHRGAGAPARPGHLRRLDARAGRDAGARAGRRSRRRASRTCSSRTAARPASRSR